MFDTAELLTKTSEENHREIVITTILIRREGRIRYEEEEEIRKIRHRCNGHYLDADILVFSEARTLRD